MHQSATPHVHSAAQAPPALSARQATRVFLLLSGTRWLPVGLVVGVFPLLALERGLSVAQIGAYVAVQGVIVALLELPTSGFADAFGRRPLLLVAGVVNVATAVLYSVAYSFWAFAGAAALMGVYRALDSGPLEAWYVDEVHVTTPGADVDTALSRQGVVVGVALGSGALLSGALVAWHPVTTQSALLLPVQCFAALCVLHLLATAIFLKERAFRPPLEPGVSPRRAEVRRALASARQAPAVIRDGLLLARRSRVLAGVLLVELFWVTGMTVFEMFQPLRLAELLGSEERAGALMGPVAAAAWGVFALGSAIGGALAGRIGVARTAMLSRALNGLGAAVMGLMTSPAGLVAAYLTTYTFHGTGGPVHSTLLHREATASNRATVLSMNSMVMFLGGAVAQPALGLLAVTTSTQTAMVTGGLISVLGLFLYLPAVRVEGRGRAEAAGTRRRFGRAPSPSPSSESSRTP